MNKLPFHFLHHPVQSEWTIRQVICAVVLMCRHADVHVWTSACLSRNRAGQVTCTLVEGGRAGPLSRAIGREASLFSRLISRSLTFQDWTRTVGSHHQQKLILDTYIAYLGVTQGLPWALWPISEVAVIVQPRRHGHKNKEERERCYNKYV